MRVLSRLFRRLFLKNSPPHTTLAFDAYDRAFAPFKGRRARFRPHAVPPERVLPEGFSADIRRIPKGRGLQKQSKKSTIRGSKHHETKLCSPRDRFSPAVRIELGENGGDVKLGGVKRDSQPTCDRFVGGAVCHRRKDFELTGR